MAANCNISSIAKEIFDKKRFGLQCTGDEYSAFVQSYLSELGCNPSVCIPIQGPCDRISIQGCSTFVLPSFRFTHQAYGTSIDFIVSPADLNGVEPYTYSWTFDPQYFSVRVPGSNLESTLKLTKLQETNINMNYLTNVTVQVTDANGCTFSKTCQFKYTKDNGVSSGVLNCDTDTFIPCTIPGSLNTSSITNTSFNILWNDLGFQYEVTVATDAAYLNQIYYSLFAHSPVAITGLTPNTTYFFKVVNKGCNLMIEDNVDTNNIPIANIDCETALFSPVEMFVNVPYTGTMLLTYDFGNGVTYSAVNYTNAGLNFNLPAGTLNNGSGNLVFTVTGVPTGSISLPINLFGTTCTIDKNVNPVCPSIDEIIVNIGNYNQFTNLYDVTISWTAVPGAATYVVFDGTTTYITANTFFNLQIPPATNFSGTVQSDCRLGSVGDEVAYEGSTPEINCDFYDFTISNVTSNGFSVTAILPVIVPGQVMLYELYLLPDTVTPIDANAFSTLPKVFTGLAPGDYQLKIYKRCTEVIISDPITKPVTIVVPPEPTVYVKVEYVNSIVVPADTYGSACNNEGYHIDMQSKPAIANIRTYSDPAGTIPLNVTGMGIVVTLQTRTKTGNFSCPAPGIRNTIGNTVVSSGSLPLSSTSTPYTSPSGNFEDSYAGAIVCSPGNCVPVSWLQKTLEILPGAGYTVI